MCLIGATIKVMEIPKEKALIGYRSWNLGLASLAFNKAKSKWRLGKTVRAHAPPTKVNHSGLWSFKSAEKQYYKFKGRGRPIQGIIKLWGTVVIHENGYRCSHAEIIKITKGKEFLPQLTP